MATEKRTSEQGNVFDAATVCDFLLAALSHDAVIDQVNDLLFEHVVNHKDHPSVIASSLGELIPEILQAATYEDWERVTSALIADARETLGVDTSSRAPGVQRPRPAQRRALVTLDPGELREMLAEIYTHDFVMPSTASRAEWITRRISKLTGMSHQQIQADAKADAEAIKAADVDTVQADQGSAQTPAPDVNDVPAEQFVRRVRHAEALALMDKGVDSYDPATRKRAAIILASSVGCTVSELATLQATPVAETNKIIAAFNQRGLASLEQPR